MAANARALRRRAASPSKAFDVGGQKLYSLVSEDRNTTILLKSLVTKRYIKIQRDKINARKSSGTIFTTAKVIKSGSQIKLAHTSNEGVQYLRVREENDKPVVGSRGTGKDNCLFEVTIDSNNGRAIFASREYKKPMYLSITDPGGKADVGLSKSINDKCYFHIVRAVVDHREFKTVLKHANANWKDSDTGETPLIKASRLGYYEFVKIMLEENEPEKKQHEDASKNYHADVAAVDYDGNSALCAAASCGWLSIVDLLHEKMRKLNGGASIHLANNEGWDARLCAAVYGKTVVLYRLCQEKSGEKLTELKDKKGNTALHLAAIGGHLEMVIMLVELFEMDIEARNYRRCTPLMMAYYYGWGRIVEFLARHGALTSHKDIDNRTITPTERDDKIFDLSKFATNYRKVNEKIMNQHIENGFLQFSKDLSRISKGIGRRVSENEILRNIKTIRGPRLKGTSGNYATLDRPTISMLRPSTFMTPSHQIGFNTSVEAAAQTSELRRERKEAYLQSEVMRMIGGPKNNEELETSHPHVERKKLWDMGEYQGAIRLIKRTCDLALETDRDLNDQTSRLQIPRSTKIHFLTNQVREFLNHDFSKTNKLALEQEKVRRDVARVLDQDSASKLFQQGKDLILKHLEEMEGATYDSSTKESRQRAVRAMARDLEDLIKYVAKQVIFRAYSYDPTKKEYLDMSQPHKLMKWVLHEGLLKEFPQVEERLGSIQDRLEALAEQKQERVTIFERPTWLKPPNIKPELLIDPESAVIQNLYPMETKRPGGTIFNIPYEHWLSSGDEVEKQCTNFYKMFFFIDEDRSGTVTVEELDMALSSRRIQKELSGTGRLKFAKATASELMEQLDENKDGLISAKEFFSGYLEVHFELKNKAKLQLLSDWVSQIYEVFSKIDLKGTGKVRLSRLTGEPRIKTEVKLFLENTRKYRPVNRERFDPNISFGQFIVGLLRERAGTARDAGKDPWNPVVIRTRKELSNFFKHFLDDVVPQEGGEEDGADSKETVVEGKGYYIRDGTLVERPRAIILFTGTDQPRVDALRDAFRNVPGLDDDYDNEDDGETKGNVQAPTQKSSMNRITFGHFHDRDMRKVTRDKLSAMESVQLQSSEVQLNFYVGTELVYNIRQHSEKIDRKMLADAILAHQGDISKLQRWAQRMTDVMDGLASPRNGENEKLVNEAEEYLDLLDAISNEHLAFHLKLAQSKGGSGMFRTAWCSHGRRPPKTAEAKAKVADDEAGGDDATGNNVEESGDSNCILS